MNLKLKNFRNYFEGWEKKYFISKIFFYIGMLISIAGYIVRFNHNIFGLLIIHLGIISLLTSLGFYVAGKYDRFVQDATDFLY